MGLEGQVNETDMHHFMMFSAEARSGFLSFGEGSDAGTVLFYDVK